MGSIKWHNICDSKDLFSLAVKVTGRHTHSKLKHQRCRQNQALAHVSATYPDNQGVMNHYEMPLTCSTPFPKTLRCFRLKGKESLSILAKKAK